LSEPQWGCATISWAYPTAVLDTVTEFALWNCHNALDKLKGSELFIINKAFSITKNWVLEV
jgi:hypothetical protein